MSNRESGFTILEALVAFAILSAVLVALYTVAGTSLRLTDSGDHLYRAAQLAQSKLDEIAAIHDPLPPVATGTFSGSDVRWRVEANDLPGQRPGPLRLQRVRLMLSWPGNGQALAFETRHLGVSRP